MEKKESYIEEKFGTLLAQVKDQLLVSKAKLIILDLMENGNGGKGWDNWEMPFTLNMQFDARYTLAHHTYWVTKIALSVAQMFEEAMNIPINYDFLIIGGLLHDVGKLAESKEKETSFTRDTEIFRQFRHPAYGAMVAKQHGLPDEICHIILAHAHEGDELYRSKEAQIIHRADFIYYGTLRSHLGLK